MQIEFGDIDHIKNPGQLTIATVVDNAYHNWLPLWFLAIARAYPDYQPIAFTTDELTSWMRYRLFDLAEKLQGDGYLTSLAVIRPFEIKRALSPIEVSALRYLLFTPALCEKLFRTPYTYITSVDTLIMPESPPLCEQHISHMAVTGLPYSNVTVDSTGLLGPHLFARRDYIKTVAPIVEKHYTQFMAQEPDRLSHNLDLELLTTITESAGIDIPSSIATSKEWRISSPATEHDQPPFSPQHGIHVGDAKYPEILKQHSEMPHQQFAYLHLLQLASEEPFWIAAEGLLPRSMGLLLRTITAYSKTIIRAAKEDWSGARNLIKHRHPLFRE